MKHEFIINKTALKPRRKQLGFWFKRQVSISNYVVDFYCPQKRLAIELDGSVHKTTSQKKYDLYRTRYLQAFNITEIRFWNHQIFNNIKEVVIKIQTILTTPTLLPPPKLGGGKGRE